MAERRLHHRIPPIAAESRESPEETPLHAERSAQDLQKRKDAGGRIERGEATARLHVKLFALRQKPQLVLEELRPGQLGANRSASRKAIMIEYLVDGSCALTREELFAKEHCVLEYLDGLIEAYITVTDHFGTETSCPHHALLPPCP